MNKNRQLDFKDEREDIATRLATIHEQRHPVALLLDRIQDPKNIGTIFRLAEAARVEKIYLYRCDFDEKNKNLVRASRSTMKYVPFLQITDFQELKNLQETFEFVSLEVTEQSISYTDFQPTKKILLIIGSENYGVSAELLDLSSTTIHIPMYGINTSMNVACATGIAIYDLLGKLT